MLPTVACPAIAFGCWLSLELPKTGLFCTLGSAAKMFSRLLPVGLLAQAVTEVNKTRLTNLVACLEFSTAI